MFLSALLLAAAVQATPPPPAAPRAFIGSNGRLTRIYGSESQALAAMTRREACQRSLLQLVDKDAVAELRSLGDLPQAHHTLTVLRTQGGCPTSSTIRFNVGR